MRNSIILVALLSLTIATGFFFFSSFTGNVAAPNSNFLSLFSVNEKIVSFSLSDGMNLSADSIMLFSLSKGSEILATRTIHFADFVALATNSLQQDVQSYAGPVKYDISLENLLGYSFNETGKYELFVQLPTLGVTNTISVQINSLNK